MPLVRQTVAGSTQTCQKQTYGQFAVPIQSLLVNPETLDKALQQIRAFESCSVSLHTACFVGTRDYAKRDELLRAIQPHLRRRLALKA
jgi:chorismate-pyruvate lyase